MPNYRKKKQSYSNNRNKNKNKNQSNITSSSVKQELRVSEFESVGIRPNLPADVSFSCIETTATSTSVLDIEKGVVVVNDDDDSSPSSNEEINVDIDTCSSDTKTVLTQSNYLSSLCSSSSKQLTEIEQQSNRTVLDGDSIFGNSVITDTFEAGTGINSSKTGSAHTKDAAVPTAVKSATKSIETTRISEGSVDENRSNSGRIRDSTELTSENDDRGATKVIVHDILDEPSAENRSVDYSNRISSKDDHSPEVIVHTTFKKVTKKSASSNQSTPTVQQIPQTISSTVIVHQVSKKDSPQSPPGESKNVIIDPIPTSKVIVHQEEESKTTKHIASKAEANQPPKVITQKISKKKAVRSTTSSLQTAKDIEDHSVIVQEKPEESAKVIVHQISREDSPQPDAFKNVKFNPNPQEISKVIERQTSKEGSPNPILSSKSTKEPSPPKKVAFDPISKDISKVIFHQISQEDVVQIPKRDSPRSSVDDTKKVTFHPIPQEVSKVIVHEILKEDSVQEESSALVTATGYIDRKAKLSVHEFPHETSTQSILSVGDDHRTKVIVDHTSSESSTVPTSASPTASKEVVDHATNVNVQQTPATKGICHQTPVDAGIQPSPKEVIIPIHVESSTSSQLETLATSALHQNPLDLFINPPEEEEDIPTNLIARTKSPRPSQTQQPEIPQKEVIIPILVEDSTQTSPSIIPTPVDVINYTTPLDIEEEYLPSTVIFEHISKDRSTDAKISAQAEEEALSTKVIVHPILKEDSTQTELTPLQTNDNLNTPPTPPPRTAFPVCRSPKVIVHQIYRDGSSKAVFPFTPKSLEKIDKSSRKIANQILLDVSSELQSSFRAEIEKRASHLAPPGPVLTSFPLFIKERSPLRPGFFESFVSQIESNPTETQVGIHRTSGEESKAKSENTASSDLKQKVIVHQTSSEESKLSQPSFPLYSAFEYPIIRRKKSHGKHTVDSSSTSEDLDSKLIAQQILGEKFNSTESISTLSSTQLHPENPDRRIQSDSGTKSAVDEPEPNLIPHFPHSEYSFPLSTYKENHEDIRTPKDLESDVTPDQIYQEESSSTQETSSPTPSPLPRQRKDSRIQSYSGTKSEDFEPNVVDEQPETSPNAFPISAHKGSHEITSDDSSSSSDDQESKLITQQIFGEGYNSTESTSTLASIQLHPGKPDQRVQSDSGTKSDDFQPKVVVPETPPHVFPISTHNERHRRAPVYSNVIVHQIFGDESNSSELKSTSISDPSDSGTKSVSDDLALNLSPLFPLSTYKKKHEEIRTSNDLNSDVIEHQIYQEESSSTQSTTSPTSSPSDRKRKDSRIQSYSGTKSDLEDIEPEANVHPVNLPHTFPLSTHKRKHEEYPATTTVESEVLVQQISQEESKSTSTEHRERKDSRIQSDSGTKTDETDILKPEIVAHSARAFPLSTRKKSHGTPPVGPKVLVHQTYSKQSNSFESNSSPILSDSYPVRTDQRIQSDSGTRSGIDDPEPTLIPHFTNSEYSFPLSTYKKKHEDTRTPKDLESDVTADQIYQEESSPTSSPLPRQRKDSRIQSYSGTKSDLEDLEPEANTHPVNSPHIFPQSTHNDSYGSTPAESKVIVHQILRDASDFEGVSEDNFTSISDPSHPVGKDQRIQSESGTKSIDEFESDAIPHPLNSLHSFPLSTYKKRHEEIRTLNELESEVIVHHISREESSSTQSTSFPTSTPSHPERKDRRILSDSGTKTDLDDLEPSVYKHPAYSSHDFPLSAELLREDYNPLERSPSPTSSSLHPTQRDQRIQSDSGTKTTFDELESSSIYSQTSNEGFKPSYSEIPVNTHPSFPLSTHKHRHATIPSSKHHESKVIVHRISREESNSTQSTSFPTSTPSHPERKDRRILSDSGTKTDLDDLEPSVYKHPAYSSHDFPLSTELLREEYNPPERSPSPTSSSLHPTQRDQRIQSDSGTKTTFDELEQSLTDNQSVYEGFKPSYIEIPVNTHPTFPLSTHKQRHVTILPSDDLQSKVIVHQISREETNSSPASIPAHPERKDRRIESDSGTKTIFDDLKPSLIPQQPSDTPEHFRTGVPLNSSHHFPLSTHKKKHVTHSKTNHFESKVNDHQISRKQISSSQSSSSSSHHRSTEKHDQRIRSDSDTRSALEDFLLSDFPLTSPPSFPLGKKDKSTQFNSNKKIDPDRKLNEQTTWDELSSVDVNFPVSSGLAFPLSTEVKYHPVQYTPTHASRELKEINLQTLREESKLHQSSSTLTSPFALTVTAEKKNQGLQSNSEEAPETSQIPLTSFPLTTAEPDPLSTLDSAQSTDPQPKPVVDQSLPEVPQTTSSSSASSEKVDHETQSSRKPTDLETKEIDLQILREKAHLRQSSSTLTSPFAVTVTPQIKDRRLQSETGSKNSADDLESKVITEEIKSIKHETSKNESIPSLSSIQSEPDPKTSASNLQSKVVTEEILPPIKSIEHETSKNESIPSSSSIQSETDPNTSASDLQSKVITEEILPPIKSFDHQTSQDESISSSSSSEESVRTTIQVKSPKSESPPVPPEDQKKKLKQKSPRSSFFLTSVELATQPKGDNKSDSSDTETLRGGSETPSEEEITKEMSSEYPTTQPPEVDSSKVITHQIVKEKTPPETGRVIIHPIVREIATDKPLAYRVESPQPDRRLVIVKKSKSFDDDDIIIQEISDTSSAGDTDNQPVISEAESETDTLEAIDDFPDSPINSRVLSIQTLPIDHEDDNTGAMSPKTAQDYKNRRQQNRAALESHFLPQFLSPMFLDSIKEENSDQSDSERRSECSDRTDHAPQQGDLEDDVFAEGGPLAKKADAVFPKSNLDFSKKHKHVTTNVRPPKTSIIREEAPPPSVVEAKIIDQGSVEECCSSWSADLTPQSEDAEVVYIDSASSSVSDLLELDYSQGQPDDSIDVRIQTPTIDLESVNEMFAYRPSESNEPPQSTSPPPLPPVKEEKENISENILLPPLADRVGTTNTLPSEPTTTQTAMEQKIPHDEIILEKIETMSETVAVRNNDDDDVAAAADRAQNFKANNPNSCDSAINEVVTNDTPSVAVGNIEKMENLREIVSASVQSELNTITNTDRDILKPIFKIGEPCSDHTLKCDTRTTTSSSTSSYSSTTTTTTATSTTSASGTQILTLHDLSKTLGDTQHLHPLGSASSALDRQESLDSHGSDQSQSTNQSQCTAINQGSLPHCDWNEIDTTTDTTYVSGSDTAGLASSENSSPLTTGGNRSGDDTESPPIRKLRSLCTEALASLPYGEEVLEELATVAQNIGEMPYPLPQLPHIQDIRVSLRTDPQKSSVITLSQVPPTSTPVGQKFKSPPPPPVPEPPSKYDSWFGVPTESDPSVLVCLSPSQRAAVKDDSTADSLLDMHKKFVERRGYHEYTTKQVNAMNREQSNETVILSKSNSPPPPPLPPRPQQPQPPQAAKSNGNETATETDINTDDQNNHRLLAIIRDTHESQQQQQQQHYHHQQSENISRRTESIPTTTSSYSTTTTSTNSGGGQEEFANSPSVSKQTQERFVSESNQSQSAHHEMQTGQTERTIKIDREPILGLRFPTSDYFDSIFDGKTKRFSNIETGSSPGFCSQILNTQPKRYSNIETSSFESRKCVENGKVLYDVSDSKRQAVREGEKPDDSIGLTSFPGLKTKVNSTSGFPYISTTPNQVDLKRTQTGDSENIMSAFKLNTQTTAPPPPAHRVEASPPAPPVPPLPPTLVDTTATSTTTKSTSTSESVINRNFNGETKETIFDDFRQRAKEAAAGEQQQQQQFTSGRKKSDAFDHERLFKDFDELSNLLKDELESGKRRPPATLSGSEIPASVSDYNRVARESKIQSSHVSSSTTEHSRREQMKKLADEIDRTSAQRQQHRREMRIPIRIEKPTPTPPRSAPAAPQQPPSYEIPVQVENGTQTQRTYEIPIRVENGTNTQRKSDHQTLHHQRSYEIPVRVEHQTGTRQRTHSEHQSEQRSHEVPIRVERAAEEPERFRRAESMFNISDTASHRHLLHDDWMKYVGDLGSSENICKPFQREVEICYLGRRPNIRAPRMSASTSDLSSTQSFDTYGAYDVRRTTTTQTPRPQQPPRRRFLSTQSLIDTTPITSCVSSRRSPAPERRSSLPREIHDQQLKYISSKEHQLQLEFERLENERRQLIDEMNRAQINQRINREAYRQRQLPPLTEDESFRQQMAEEWLHKVAEREERRLQKIIKISKINQDANFPTAPPRRVSSSDIGDEFLRRVKERRSKLCMPSDSDWESGAESQPAPRTDGSRSENDEPPPVTVLEGKSEADIKHLPKHLREFAKLTSQVKEDHHEETTENTSCSAVKKSSVVTTVKTSNTATNTNNNQQKSTQHESEHAESLQQDAARVRDLEQLSQGKRQKLVTILRHKKPAESSSAGGCQPVPVTEVGSVTAASNSGGGGNSAKRRKQTRFLLTPNRRSWSESDLLREIDKELVLAKGFLYANESIQSSEMFAPKFKATAPQGSGVWTPKNQTPSSSRTNLNEFQPYNKSSITSTTCSDKISANRSSSACGLNQSQGIPPPPPPPLWTPQPERKQFRPVHFESPKLQRRYVRQQSTPSEAAPPPWSYTNSQPFPGYQSQSCTNLNQKNTAIPWPPPPAAAAATQSQNGTAAIVDDSVVDDDDGFAATTSIAEKIRSFERSTSNTELHRPFVRHNPHEKPAILRPNEVIYSVKNEYMSEPETEYDKPKKMAQLSRRQYDGIGPTTKDGMPVVLRSEVKEPNQHEWYKRIFQTIHKQKNPDDYVTIRYKCPRGRYPYKSNGYMSEPEPNYDSDYSTVKYRTLERRRLQSSAAGTGTVTGTGPSTGLGNDSQDDTVYGTMPNPVKSGQGSYKVQPGRIEDYITGHSSVSEKEKKEWWDEVMDIFNGWLKDNDTLPRVFIEFANEVEQFQLDQQKLSPHYTEGNLSRALLKEQGYTSDSNLVFRKKDVPQQQSPLSPVEQKQVYKSVQAGGQPPLLGFRKPAPEKPKDSDEVPPPPVPPKGVSLDSNGFSNLESPNRYFESDVNIHYKTPIRYEYKDAIPEEELAIRQAESMQKLYQEERRRKYLQELQDMNSRRHTDNFTPSQKSPIPLNRYDDFNSDLAPKSPNSSNYPRTIARALYNFQGQTARELTFKKGDVIYIRRQIDKNWYEGEHNAMIGLLPSNYVEIITKDGVRQPPKKPSEGQARAKYNFQAQSGIELSLNKGEHVTLTRRVDDNWFEGKIANRKGIFPVSYVEILVDIGAEDKATRTPATQSIITQSSSVRPSLDTLRTNINNEFNSLTSNGQPPNGILRETRTLHKTEVLHVDTNTEPVAYRALYKYRPQNTDELELQEGDIVYVLEKCDDGWFVGTSQRSSCFGTFPGNYVERV